MSWVGGIAKVTPARHEDADQSTKRQPDAQDHVGRGRQRIADGRSGVADRLAGQRMRLVDRALPVPGRHDRRAEPLGDGAQLGGRVGPDHAAAGDDHRAACVGQKPGGAFDGVRVRARAAARLSLRRLGER